MAASLEARGTTALASHGSAGIQYKLTAQQLLRGQFVLDAEPAARVWSEDQRWTLAQAVQLIRTLFRVRIPEGVSYLLHRPGWSAQVPCTERPNATRTRCHLGEGDLARGGTTRREQDAWLVFEDEASQSFRHELDAVRPARPLVDASDLMT